MGKKKMLMRKFGSVAIVNNTFIGGVASVINTPTLLAAKLKYYPSGAAFSENDIQNFTVVGSDIECYIGVDYQIKQDAFKNVIFTTSSPTYYKDEGSKCKQLQVRSFYGSLNTSNFYFPAVVSVLNGCFYHANYTNLQPRIIYLPICTSVSGDPTVIDTQQFGFGNITQKLYIGIFNKTSNNGGINATIAHSIANDNLTVSWVENLTKPNQVTDLTATTVYATAIKLDCSIPTSTNAIDYYEVYVDGVFYKNVNTNEIKIFGLTNLQTYNFSVIAVDIFYNKSEMSNVVTQQINGVGREWLDNIISYYKFENNVLDSVGSNNGVATDITYASGQVGNAAVFNGSTSKVLLPTNFLPYSPSFSVHCVFKADNINSEYRLIALSDNVNMPYILLRLNNTVLGRIGFYVYNNNTVTEIFSDAYDSTTYTQVTATITENGDFKLYINANLIDTKSILNFTTLSNQNYLGTARNASSLFFDGDFDDTSFFNKELSQTEVTEIYNLHSAGFPLI